jgi:hypothetical protein
MSKTAYILGKGASLSDHLHIDWSSKVSYGLNEAAVVANTQYGFTGHEKKIDFYEENAKKYVLAYPTFEFNYLKPPLAVDFINNYAPDVYYTLTNERKEFIDFQVDLAANGIDYRFRQYGTILHLAIFYLILKGHKKINLIGCRGECNSIPPYVNTGNRKYQRHHTDLIIESAKRHNINIKML